MEITQEELETMARMVKANGGTAEVKMRTRDDPTGPGTHEVVNHFELSWSPAGGLVLWVIRP